MSAEADADVDADAEAGADGEPSDGAAADADALAAGLAAALADGDVVPPAQAAAANARVTANAPAGTKDERAVIADVPPMGIGVSVAGDTSSTACGRQGRVSQIHRGSRAERVGSRLLASARDAATPAAEPSSRVR